MKTTKQKESCKSHQRPVTGGSSRRAVRPRRTSVFYPTEAEEQKMLASWLDRRFGPKGWVHVPNEMVFLKFLRGVLPEYLFEKIKFAIIGFMKKLGLKKEFPDILIFALDRDPVYRRIGHYGMAIELKRQKGGCLRPGQKAYLEFFDSIGWATAVAYGAQDAINKITEVYGR